MTGWLPISLREHDLEIKKDWPSFRTMLFDPRHQCATWRGELHPQINIYTVEIEYSMKQLIDGPKVRVISPSLVRCPGNNEGSLPHMYDRDTDPYLCLFDPRAREWTGWMSISKKIIPWTIDWLACYEDWLLTGVWHGGGRHVTTFSGMHFDLEAHQ